MAETLWVDYSYARPDVTPYAGVMRYLNISATGTKGLTPAELGDLQAKGKPVGLIWETSANAAAGGSATAVDHAARANAEADRLGAPKDVAIFYAVDFDTTAPEQWEPYVVALLAQPGRPVGVYGEADVTRRARELGALWTWQTLAWSKGAVDPDANLYQRDFQTGYDVSLEQHPFPAWGRPMPTPTPEEPPVARVTWRGITTDAETALYLTAVAKEVTVMAKAAGFPDWTVTPIPRCGSYQTTTAASSGTHAGGGAVDINAVGLTDKQARVLESAARKCGGTAWFRPALAGVWQKHVHILRSDCTDLAYAARQQVKAYRAGYNGLANNGPDTGNRSWVNVTWAQVKAAASVVISVGSAVVVDAKVRGIQHALRQKVDGKLGPVTYAAVWRLSLASREGRAGFYKIKDVEARKQLQRDIGAKHIDGAWIANGSEMPRLITDAVGGVQRAMGLKVDRVWTDSVEGVQFKRLYTAAGFKP